MKFSLDGEHVLYAVRDAASGTGIYHVRDLPGGTPTPLMPAANSGLELIVPREFSVDAEHVLGIIVYDDGVDYSVAIVDATGTHAAQTIDTFPKGDTSRRYVGPAGPRHAYYIADGVGLTLVARDEAGVLQQANHLCARRR